MCYDFIFCYRKKDQEVVDATKAALQLQFELNLLGELKCFIEIHVLRDRQSKKLWLSQKAYIDKLITKFDIDVSGTLPFTPMAETELLPLRHGETGNMRLYQRKTGSILFAAVIRPEIAFGSSRLARFNTNPSDTHHEAADQVIKISIPHKWILYTIWAREGDNNQYRTLHVLATLLLWITRSIGRALKVIMTLFGGPIAWRANQQDTRSLYQALKPNSSLYRRQLRKRYF
jgi:hypothetical protein